MIKEVIILIIYCSALALDFLLMLIGLENRSFLIIFSSLLFVVAIFFISNLIKEKGDERE